MPPPAVAFWKSSKMPRSAVRSRSRAASSNDASPLPTTCAIAARVLRFCSTNDTGRSAAPANAAFRPSVRCTATGCRAKSRAVNMLSRTCMPSAKMTICPCTGVRFLASIGPNCRAIDISLSAAGAISA